MSELSYKGYTAGVEFSAEDGLLIGRVLNIEGLIMFSAGSVIDLVSEFHAAIDSYIASCTADKVDPQKPYKGTFNVRIGSDNHRSAANIANSLGMSLNEFIRLSVELCISRHQSRELVVIGKSLVTNQAEAYPLEAAAHGGWEGLRLSPYGADVQTTTESRH